MVQQLLRLRRGERLKEVLIGGVATTAIVQKGRSRGKRMSAAAKKTAAATRRRIKLPLLTIGANLLPALGFVGATSNLIKAGISSVPHQRQVANSIAGPYFGINFQAGGGVNFSAGRLLGGLVPNLIVFAINRLGVFRSTNQKLANARIPVRLN